MFEPLIVKKGLEAAPTQCCTSLRADRQDRRGLSEILCEMLRNQLRNRALRSAPRPNRFLGRLGKADRFEKLFQISQYPNLVISKLNIHPATFRACETRHPDHRGIAVSTFLHTSDESKPLGEDRHAAEAALHTGFRQDEYAVLAAGALHTVLPPPTVAV